MDLVGQILGERYHVERYLGSGRFASVYAATDTWDGTTRALKVFRASTEQRTAVGRRFFRRTKSAMTSPHPVIVPIKDHGKTPDDLPFVVMELLEGTTINDAINQNGAFGIATSLSIAHTMLEGLAAAHSQGYVHRNINPSNVFLIPRDAEQPDVRILDFGIAQDLVDYLAIAPSAFGSTSYLAPEILLDTDRAWTPAVDVFATGTVLFLMLTGRLPFDKEAYVGSGKNTINAYASIFKLPGPATFVPHIPRPIDDFVQKALAIEQWERFKNALEMLNSLDSALSRVDISQLDAVYEPDQRQLITKEQWDQQVDTDDDETMPGNISAAVHEYAEHYVSNDYHVPQREVPETRVVQQHPAPPSTGSDISGAVNAYMDLFSPSPEPFEPLDFPGQYDPTKKTTLPEVDEDHTLEAEPPRPIGREYQGSPTVSMEEPPAFDVPALLAAAKEEARSSDSMDETLDQDLDERDRLLLDSEGGIETPSKVLEKLYYDGVDLNSTIVESGDEQINGAGTSDVEPQIDQLEDDSEDDLTETRPLPVQPRRQAVREFPPELEHYDTTEEMSAEDSDRAVARYRPSTPQMSPPPAEGSVVFPSGRHILEKGRQHRLSSADVKVHFPGLRRRKIAKRVFLVLMLAALLGVIVFVALRGFSIPS